MAEETRDIIESPPGYGAREAGSFMSQLDDLTTRLTADLEGATPEELSWQPAPGMNSIGMLLEHIAIVEVFWTQVGPLGLTEYATDDILGIDSDHDGIPLPAGASPPAALRGKALPYFLDLLARARAYAKAAAAALGEADLDRMGSRVRRNGNRESYNLRWVLYHMVEHFAGHYYQINTLRHHYRVAHTPARRDPAPS